MTLSESLLKLEASAVDLMEYNDNIRLLIEVEETGFPIKRVSIQEANLIAERLREAKVNPYSDEQLILADAPNSGKSANKWSVSFRRILEFPKQNYWLDPNGEIETSNSLNSQLRYWDSPSEELKIYMAGVEKFDRNQMADLLAWHALRYGWENPERIGIDWNDKDIVEEYSYKFVLRWFKKLHFDPFLDDAIFIQKEMLKRIKERSIGDNPPPKRIPVRKPVSWADEVMAIDADPGGTAMRELVVKASEGYSMAFLSLWTPPEIPIGPGHLPEFCEMPTLANLSQLGTLMFKCRFEWDGKLVEDIIHAVVAEPEESVRLAEFSLAAGHIYKQSVLLVTQGRASILDLKDDRTVDLGSFDENTIKKFYEIYGRKNLILMREFNNKLNPQDRLGIRPMCYLWSKTYRATLEYCIREGKHFWDTIVQNNIKIYSPGQHCPFI